MNLLRLPVSVFIMLAMTLMTYMIPQWAGSRLSMLTMDSPGVCSEKGSGEEVLRSLDSPVEQSEEEGCSSSPAVFAEEETDSDDFLFSEHGLILPGHGRERSVHAPSKHSSHISTQSRRPPRVSIA